MAPGRQALQRAAVDRDIGVVAVELRRGVYLARHAGRRTCAAGAHPGVPLSGRIRKHRCARGFIEMQKHQIAAG